VQRLFPRWIRQREPLRQVVVAQHSLDAEQRPAGLGTRVLGLQQLHRRRPLHHEFHLFEELALSRPLRQQVQAKSKLPHGRHRRPARRITPAASARGFADLP